MRVMYDVTTHIFELPLSLVISMKLRNIHVSKLHFIVHIIRCDVNSDHLIVDVAHDDAVRLVLLRYLANLEVLVHLLRICTLLARTAVFGTWRHYLQVLVHGLMQMRSTCRLLAGPAKYLYVLHRSLQVLQLTAAVNVVAAMHRVVRAHPLNDKAILDHLVHIRLLSMQTLLNFVVGLLDQSRMLIEVYSRQIVMRLLRKCSLLGRRLDHPSIILTILKQIVLLRFIHIGR